MNTARRPAGVTGTSAAFACGAAISILLLVAPALPGGGGAPGPADASWRWTLGAVWAQVLLLLPLRRAPRLVLPAVAAVPVLLAVIAPSGIGNVTGAAVVVAVVRAVLRTPLVRLRSALPVAGVLVAVGQAADVAGAGELALAPAIGSGVLQAVVIVGLPAAATVAVVARREALAARTAELAAVQRERDATVRAAVADERASMARELHDIAAHHVSSIALMAAAIERQVDADPAAAKRAVRDVRAQSRALLDDLRRLVGLLREDAAEPEAVETLVTVPALVNRARTAGAAVELRTAGTADGVGPLAQLVAFRMVQESLANAAQHAPGAAVVVELDGAAADRYVVLVANGAPHGAAAASTGGFGLLGMRERAELVGGVLEAGPADGGGWRVRLELPSEPDRAEQRR